MPRNSSGIYTQPASDVNPPISASPIDPLGFAAAMIDISTELTNSLDRNGRGAMAAPLSMGGFKLTNAAPSVAATDGVILSDLTTYMPAGAVINFAAANQITFVPPSGYLRCNGSAASRTIYATLFAVIGTTFGAGDGSTTFNLPNISSPSFQVACIRT